MKFRRSILVGLFAGSLSALALTTCDSQAAGISNYYQNKIVDHSLRGVAWTAPTVLCVALTTATPTAASTGATIAEASYTGYARGALNPSTTNWAATNGVGTTTNPSSGTSGTSSNNSTITIGSAATTGPTVVTSFAVLDSCTVGAGNVLFFSALTASKTINNGDPAPTFGAAALTVQPTQ